MQTATFHAPRALPAPSVLDAAIATLTAPGATYADYVRLHRAVQEAAPTTAEAHAAANAVSTAFFGEPIDPFDND
ncbi:MAG: hypothetical protein H7Y38_12475 [Armatimonadetes bacterium]|nr:hypothetical protein [Armatimonadota bacterium]